ncbi:hypothetical protein [Ottowia sp.]|uniref:hypothetical protein n=1 Tax=Ottowia sp. TaxID=1898956 RepID=UPI003A86EA59
MSLGQSTSAHLISLQVLHFRFESARFLLLYFHIGAVVKKFKYYRATAVALAYISTFGAAHARGNVEIVSLLGNNLTIAGWACDPTKPNEFVGIHMYQNSAWLGGGNAPIPREAAVAAVCSSIHSNHGFSFKIALPTNLIDGAIHKVQVYAVGSAGYSSELSHGVQNSITFGTTVIAPTQMGNVAARDLDVLQPGNYFGHIGFWDGTRVIEAMNESTVIQSNTWSNFRSRASGKTWDTLKPNIPSSGVITTCYEQTCYYDVGGAFGGGATSYNYTSAGMRYAMSKRAL